MNGKYYWIGVLLTVAALFATIAPMVAARNHDVDFIVLMAGSGVPGADILVEQTLLISEASGVSKEEAEKKPQRKENSWGL